MGRARVGAIAPGYRADLVLLDDEKSCSVRSVFKDGVPSEEVISKALDPAHVKGTVKCKTPEARGLEGPGGRVHVITVEEGKILTGREVAGHADSGVARLSVIERYGHGRKPANAYVRGFGPLQGAIASSVGHDSHNLIVVGSDPRDMRAAVASLIESGGGFAVARGGEVIERLELPYGGLMSERGPAELKDGIGRLKAASRAAGCTLREPFLQLAFLSLPVIPSLKLTDRGLVDVDQFKIIGVRA
jgi:adenine deaminase